MNLSMKRKVTMMEPDELVGELSEYDVDDISEAICEHLSTGTLLCLSIDIDREIDRRYKGKHV